MTAAGDEAAPKSAGHETTFAEDVADSRFLRATVWLLADRVARRLRRHRFRAGTVAARFKIGARRFSRQRGVDPPTDEARTLALHAWDLLEAARRGRAVRLIGVAALDVRESAETSPLLAEDRRRRALTGAGDRIRDRFGEDLLLPAGIFLRENGRR